MSDAWMTDGTGHPRRWAILAVLVVSLLVVVLDNTVLNIALPTIQADLSATPAELVWSVDSYILTFAALLFTWGVIGDRVGRKRVLIIGLIVFAVASAICAFAINAAMLIGFRALMGIGGAAVLPTTLAIITVVFPPHERGKAIGAWAGAVGAAVALGPVLGGLLLQHPEWSSWLTGNNWGVVFLINVPIVAVGVVLIARIVPESRNPQPRRLDLIGLVVSVLGLVLLIYGIIDASRTRDWLAPTVVWPIIAGIVVIGFFLWWERHSEHSSFDVSLFANRGYAVSLIAVTLSFFALLGITFTLPFYLQILRGFDTLTAGLCFIPFAVGQLLGAPRSAAMVMRFGYRAVMTTGLVLVALSLLALTQLTIEAPLWTFLLGFFVFGLGMGNVIAPASTVMQNVLPLARVGAGSAVQNTVRQVGGALGIAIIGTLLATQYATTIAPVLTDAGLDERQVAAASESIIATDVVLEESGASAPVIDALRTQAYDLFLDAAHLTYYVSFAIVAIAAIVVAFGLPRIAPPMKSGPPPADSEVDALVAKESIDYPAEFSEEVTPPSRANDS